MSDDFVKINPNPESIKKLKEILLRSDSHSRDLIWDLELDYKPLSTSECWKEIKNILPDDKQEIIVNCNDKIYKAVFLKTIFSEPAFLINDGEIGIIDLKEGRVTHWMDWPKLPGA